MTIVIRDETGIHERSGEIYIQALPSPGELGFHATAPGLGSIGHHASGPLPMREHGNLLIPAADMVCCRGCGQKMSGGIESETHSGLVIRAGLRPVAGGRCRNLLSSI